MPLPRIAVGRRHAISVPRIHRRALLAATVCLAAAGLSAFASTPVQAQEKRLTVMMWGATWERIFKPLSEEFKKETGITLEVVNQTTGIEGLAKIQATRAKPEVDVWFTSEQVAIRAMTDTGLFAPLPVDKIPNIKQLRPGAANDMFAALYYAPLGIVYRPDLVPGGKITSWNELWQPAFKNKVSLPVPSIFPGKMILIASLLNGGSINNIEPGLELLAKQKDQVAAFHSADAQARRALAQGEIWAMMTSPSAVNALKDQNIPAAMASPFPAPLFFEGMMMVRGGKEDLAAIFINKALSKEWQQHVTNVYNMGPARLDVPPSETFAAAMPKPGDEVVSDEKFLNENVGKWTERFNAMMRR
jgi:putative spermidine/putrescine transport system substrate-binding protein